MSGPPHNPVAAKFDLVDLVITASNFKSPGQSRRTRNRHDETTFYHYLYDCNSKAEFEYAIRYMSPAYLDLYSVRNSAYNHDEAALSQAALLIRHRRDHRSTPAKHAECIRMERIVDFVFGDVEYCIGRGNDSRVAD
ncbi:hypothetical protein PM082_023436 [Marasmius tenuissimus]|nr:hypothetical protein PM082_023436 [Marasmius tenuissimus]